MVGLKKKFSMQGEEEMWVKESTCPKNLPEEKVLTKNLSEFSGKIRMKIFFCSTL